MLPGHADDMKLPIARVQPALTFHRIRYPHVFGMFSRVFAIRPMHYKSDRTLEGRMNWFLRFCFRTSVAKLTVWILKSKNAKI